MNFSNIIRKHQTKNTKQDTLLDKEIIVLSLFDGKSGGQEALRRLDIPVHKYYASEVNESAMSVARYHFKNTIFVGDVRKIDGKDYGNNMLIGGSPCQNFSFAGKRNGMSTKEELEITTLKRYMHLKSEGFNFEGESYLFWEYVRLLKETKPTIFMLENVVMDKRWESVLTNALCDVIFDSNWKCIQKCDCVNGVRKAKYRHTSGDIRSFGSIMIDSKLVSAQQRKRLYWTNIEGIEQPQDKHIYLKDILDYDKEHDWYPFESYVNVKYKNPNRCIQVGLTDNNGGFEQSKRVYSHIGESPTVNTMGGGNREIKVCCGAIRGRRLVEGKRVDTSDAEIQQCLELRDDNKTNCITTVGKDNVVVLDEQQYFRKLTTNETEQLQTLAIDYTKYGVFEGETGIKEIPKTGIKEIPKTQRNKMIGNGWNIDSVAHIFSYIR